MLIVYESDMYPAPRDGPARRSVQTFRSFWSVLPCPFFRLCSCSRLYSSPRPRRVRSQSVVVVVVQEWWSSRRVPPSEHAIRARSPMDQPPGPLPTFDHYYSAFRSNPYARCSYAPSAPSSGGASNERPALRPATALPRLLKSSKRSGWPPSSLHRPASRIRPPLNPERSLRRRRCRP